MTEILLYETACVVFNAFLGALISEGVSWFFVYRRQSYQTLLAEIIHETNQIIELKKSAAKSLKNDSKTEALEEKLSKKNQSIGYMRMKAGILASVAYFIVVPSFNNRFEGRAVAQLPFEPIFFIKSLAHHKLVDHAANSCSSMYLYILAIGFFRTILQAFINCTPPKFPGKSKDFFTNYLEAQNKKNQ